jgi:phosphate-selective porin OprO/OprP
MTHFKRATLASIIQLSLLGIPDANAADTEALERRIRELEKRLERFEQKETVAPAPVAKTVNPEVQKLTSKVNTLERKLEIQDEVATSNFSKLPKFEAGSNGFKISSSDNNNSVRIRASVQTDGRFYMDDHNKSFGSTGPNGIADRFDLKQARGWVEGRLWKYIDYKIMPDFGGGKLTLADAYFDAHYFPYASLSVGKQKTPLSLERLQGDADGTFLERAFPTYLASNRDIGVMLHGEFAKPGYTPEYGGPVDFKNFVSYQAGIFNGAGDNGSVDTDLGDDKEFVGRIFAHPFQHTGIDFLEGFGVGIAGSMERPRERIANTLPTGVGSNSIVNNASAVTLLDTKTKTDTVAVYQNGEHYRIYPQAYWYSGPFGLLGEYVLSSQQLLGREASKAGATQRELGMRQDNSAWQIQASYVLTGEDNTFQSVKPIQAFDPVKGNWGAFQVAARWSELTIDKGSFANLAGAKNSFRLYDPSKSISSAQEWAIGLNWFLNSNVRIMADYAQTHFEGGAGTISNGVWSGGNRPTEKVFATRFQLVF